MGFDTIEINLVMWYLLYYIAWCGVVGQCIIILYGVVIDKNKLGLNCAKQSSA